jgi:hypothetical protein
MTRRPKIFVQIAAYRDPELLPTLRDCVARAAHPERLSFGICWQKDERENIGEFANDTRVRVYAIEWHRSLGLGWARSICQRLWRGEEYTLQLDAHHRFVDSWDETLVAMHRQVGGGRAIISTYAGSYTPGDASAAPRSPVPSKITAGAFRDYGTIVLVPVLIKNYERLVAPLRARFICGHFYFTLGLHCVEYRYDPNLYFLGDELSLSVRSWCLGYDLYHPHRQVVYHHFGRAGAARPWTETAAPDGAEVLRWHEREQFGLRRLRQMLGMEVPAADLGRFGLSRRRPLAGYERYAGIDFAQRLISSKAHLGIQPPSV